jgi:hypothetical protein
VESPVRGRYDVVPCTVTGHVRYGLLIESEDGERGYVDSAYVTDKPGEPWPAVGDQVRAVVLNYVQGGRLRVATSPTYVEQLIATGDPVAAADAWRQQRDRAD